MRDFRPFPSPRPGKCTQSATLREDPGENEDVVDELEPGYPLEVYGYVYVSPRYKWFRVKALPQPPGRDEAQWGWIYAPLVAVEDVPQPPPPVEPPPPDWRKFWSIVGGVIVALGALLYGCTG